MGSDLTFSLTISCQQQAAGHPVWMPRRQSLFFLLPFLPGLKLSSSLLALKEFLYLWEQHPRQSLYLMERNASDVVVCFLFCHSLSSVIKLRRRIPLFLLVHKILGVWIGSPPFLSGARTIQRTACSAVLCLQLACCKYCIWCGLICQGAAMIEKVSGKSLVPQRVQSQQIIAVM